MADEPRRRRNPSRDREITRKGYRKGEKPPNWNRTFPPTLLQPNDVVRLMQACDADKRGLRMRATIALLYRAGPLISEALALRVSDVDLEGQTLHFSSVRQADRVVGMDKDGFAVLAEWLQFRESLPGDLVLCTINRPDPGLPVHPAYFRGPHGALKKLANAAGLPDTTRVHPQAFRHSLAAELIIEGWPLSFIQTQLGIKTLDAMEHFLTNLDIGPPDPADVATVIRTRTWNLVEGV